MVETKDAANEPRIPDHQWSVRKPLVVEFTAHYLPELWAEGMFNPKAQFFHFKATGRMFNSTAKRPGRRFTVHLWESSEALPDAVTKQGKRTGASRAALLEAAVAALQQVLGVETITGLSYSNYTRSPQGR